MLSNLVIFLSYGVHFDIQRRPMTAHGQRSLEPLKISYVLNDDPSLPISRLCDRLDLTKTREEN